MGESGGSEGGFINNAIMPSTLNIESNILRGEGLGNGFGFGIRFCDVVGLHGLCIVYMYMCIHLLYIRHSSVQ